MLVMVIGYLYSKLEMLVLNEGPLKLKDVLVVPDLQKNLLPIGKLQIIYAHLNSLHLILLLRIAIKE